MAQSVLDRLLQHIRENPGCGRAAACLACDITPAALSWHVSKLRDRGLVSPVGTYALIDCRPVPVRVDSVPTMALAVLRRHIRHARWAYLSTMARWSHTQPITVRRALTWIESTETARVLYGRDLYPTDPKTEEWSVNGRVILPIRREVA